MSAVEALVKLQLDYEEAKEKCIWQIDQELWSIIKPIFDKYPKLHSFAWSQSIDYDTHEFTVYTGCLDINSVEGGRLPYYSDGFWYNGDATDLLGPGWQDWLGKAQEYIHYTIQSIPPVALRYIFGEYCSVTIHRNGMRKVEFMY